MSDLPLGVCVLPEECANRAHQVNYSAYLYEILDHAGLCYSRLTPEEISARLPSLRLLVTIGEREFDESTRAKLRDWIAAGGCWLSIGGICKMSDSLGAEMRPPSYPNWHGGLTLMGEGYLVARDRNHSSVAHLNRPLHFFGGLDVRATDARVIATALDGHGREKDQPVLMEKTIGSGYAMLLSVDLTHTIVRIQQGVAVTRDGVPAPGGNAPVCDGVLKSDDGQTLDWIFDRREVDGASGLMGFLDPVADLWRELFLRSIFHLASVRNVALPVLWFYPGKTMALGHISHDTDTNDPAKAEMLLKTLAEAEIHSTWCTILPGYPPELMQKIAAAGHELAMHYDAMTEGLAWGEDQFERQFNELTELFGGQRPTSNKNHYLRWEGDSDLWDWCVKRGIKLDQSKGTSKTGEVGFNFGTCHPYQPIRFSGDMIPILELPTPTQDLIVFAPEAVVEPMLASVKKSHGILHFLFHPAHIDKPGLPDAIKNAVRRGKQEGLQWCTARQIHEWEYARRGVKWLACDEKTVRVRSESTLKNATILRLRRGGEFHAWGFEFDATTTTIKRNQEQTI